MATLTGSTIAGSYKDLLKIAESSKQAGLDGTLRAVEDGDATASALYLATDSALISGADTKLYFYDADGGEYISADASGVLSVVAGAEIDLTATAVDLNGTLDVSGTLTVGGNIDFNSGTIDTSTQTVTVELNQAADSFTFDGASDNILSIDASNNRVGIGTASPAGILHTYQSNANNNIYFDTFDNGASSNNLYIRKSDHDSNVIETDDNDVIGSIIFQGVGTAPSFQHAASITVKQNGSAEAGYVPATMRFDTGTNTGQLNLHQGGDVEIGVGNFSISTAGKGIMFHPHDTSVTGPPGSDSNLLDDYEEGTWTPTMVQTSASSIVYNGDNGGGYTKIGRLVHLTAEVHIDSYSSGSGTITIGGIPFANAVKRAQGQISLADGFTFADPDDASQMTVELSGSSLWISESYTSGRADWSHSNLSTSGWRFWFAISYMTAT